MRGLVSSWLSFVSSWFTAIASKLDDNSGRDFSARAIASSRLGGLASALSGESTVSAMLHIRSVRLGSISAFRLFSACVSICCAANSPCWNVATCVCAATTSTGASTPCSAIRWLLWYCCSARRTASVSTSRLWAA